MKAAPPVTTHTVDFAASSAPRPTQGRVPRVARQLALAHKIEAMIREGELRDLADAARAMGLTRARVTQVMNLLLLAPAIQEAILRLPPVTSGRDPVAERRFRRRPRRTCVGTTAVSLEDYLLESLRGVLNVYPSFQPAPPVSPSCPWPSIFSPTHAPSFSVLNSRTTLPPCRASVLSFRCVGSSRRRTRQLAC